MRCREETKMTTTLTHEALMTQLWWEEFHPLAVALGTVGNQSSCSSGNHHRHKKQKTNVCWNSEKERLRGKKRKAWGDFKLLLKQVSLWPQERSWRAKWGEVMLKCMGEIMVWIMVREIATTTKVFQDKTENEKKEKKKRRWREDTSCPPASLWLRFAPEWIIELMERFGWQIFFFPVWKQPVWTFCLWCLEMSELWLWLCKHQHMLPPAHRANGPSLNSGRRKSAPGFKWLRNKANLMTVLKLKSDKKKIWNDLSGLKSFKGKKEKPWDSLFFFECLILGTEESVLHYQLISHYDWMATTCRLIRSITAD